MEDDSGILPGVRAPGGLILLATVVVLAGSACSSGSKHVAETTTTAAVGPRTVKHVTATRRRPLRLVERVLALFEEAAGNVPAALERLERAPREQDAALVVLHERARSRL